MSDHRAHIPTVVADYYIRRDGAITQHPVVRQEFHPLRGWKTTNYRKRITVSWAQKLRMEGCTHVALDAGDGRLADFRLADIIRGGVAGHLLKEFTS
jgi:hypothetical protein